ncbi:MAG: iron-containing redox enzyme family protein [Solirubrobacterales bacterium]
MSEAVLNALGGAAGPLEVPWATPGDPLSDDDLQLALYVAYELHYRSFAGVDPGWEWEPSLLEARRRMERAFLASVRDAVAVRGDLEPGEVARTLFTLEEETKPSLAEHLQARGSAEELKEFVVHRSAYQLKEADPHTWGIPRLHGAPKAAMVEIQADEYGSGDPDRVHATLFARAMDALGLDSSYGAYLDLLPGSTLATVNLITALGLNRDWRGALAGHLAMFEISSPLPNAKYAKALRRLGYAGEAVEFFDEHVEADSVHENIAAYDLAQALAVQQPDLTAQVVFGAEALLELESRLAQALLSAWADGRSSLRAQAGAVVA